MATTPSAPLLDEDFTGLCDDLRDVHTGIDLIRAGAVLIATDAAEGRLTRDETQTLLATLMGSADGIDILALITATTARLMRADTNPCLRELDPDTIANLNRRAEGIEQETADYAPRDYPADACALIDPYATALEESAAPEPPGPSKIRESAITGREGGIVIRVGIIGYDHTTARIVTEGCGIHVRQGEIHTVPLTALMHIDDYVT